MPAKRRRSEEKKTRRKPATTPEARENEMVSAAHDLAEQQIRDGVAFFEARFDSRTARTAKT